MTLVTFWKDGYMFHSLETGRWGMMKQYLTVGSFSHIGEKSYKVLSVEDKGCVIRVNVKGE